MQPVLYLDAFWISPWSFAAYVALKEKGIPFTTKDVALDKGEQRAAENAHALTFGKIPALLHGDLALAESTAICEYVEERWPQPSILPAGIEDRARARMVQSWLRTGLDTVRNERSAEVIFYDLAMKPLTEAGATAAAKFVAQAEKLLGGEAYLFGKRWSIADAELAFALQRLVRGKYPLPAALARYVDQQWSRPSVQAFVTHARAAFTPYY
jgi:glutathione S-transferase